MDEIQKTRLRMNENKKSCIVIPVYQTKLDNTEIVSLNQTLSIFKNEQIFIVSPNSLNLESFLESYNLNTKNVIRFADDYFKNIDGYNKLLMDSIFYEKFLEYDYMLICQLDVFVFENQLTYWVNKNYDYIGAPWLDSEKSFFRDFSRNLNSLFRKIANKKQRSFEHLNQVGNGGFSLRNVSKHYEISLKEIDLISENIIKRPSNNYYIEDVFWSIQIPQKYSDFKIPNYIEALNFAFDRKPKLAFKLNSNKYPFACHGFNKPKVFDFWKTKIDALKKISI